MEAANIGGREADLAPAADPTGGRMAGWSPADPGPLGLAAFAGTTFMLSLVNSGLVGTHRLPGGGLLPMIAALALAYGGIAQFAAGLWEFRTGNTFGAVAFCSYGAFWISFFFIVQSVGQNAPTEVFSGLGLYLWMWGIFTTYMFIASLRTTGAVAVVFLLLAITFFILGIGNASLAGGTAATNGTIKLGGWFGIVTAIAAWYASFAAVVNSTYGRVVAPVMPLSRT
ncbi:MAG TPA: acetate uptake transporter [Solirubrobacteraceae bacterium]|jgi:succinate-acetate transporter protein|nr:acetate uptake transporter [Solirubrobacteraceae bacterium]